MIAESAGGDPNNVITVGAHLDSVGTGPSINDNGSGSSAILEIGEEMSGFGPRIKTAEQAAIYGGIAGEQYDPCYHEGCDTLLNLSDTALEQMGDAAAHATVTLAQRTPSVDRPRGNGTRVPRFALPKPAPGTAQ